MAYDFDRSDAVNVFIKDVLIDNQILNLDLIEKPSDEKSQRRLKFALIFTPFRAHSSTVRAADS